MSAEEGPAEGNDAVVDINTSSVEDLAKVVGLGRAAAEAIVAARRLQGGFSRVGDLLTVPGVDAALLQELQLSLTCSPKENFSEDTQGSRWGSASSSSCGSREELAASSEAEATSLASSVNRLLRSEGLPTSDDEEGSCSSTEDMADGEDDPAATTPPGVHLKRKREVAQRLGGKKPCGWETGYSSASEGTATPATAEDRTNASPAAARRARHPSTVVQPPKLDVWLDTFQSWSHSERLYALDQLIEGCEPGQVRHMMNVIEPQFQRDFISLLPKELALYVLSFLEPRDLLRAAQTCHYWRILAEDNLLWREKCREAGLEDVQEVLGRRVATSSSSPPSPSAAGPIPWKLAFMRHHYVEMNWRCKPIREPKVLRGHEDHVITCLQFSGNRIVSGSDDNTLKVWSATSGRCLRTLIGHTGGVWSSQMAGSVVVSGSTDRTLRVWNADTGMCLHTLYGHTSTVRCMHLYGNKVVSGSRDATLRVWDLETGECLHVLVGHVAAVRCVQYNGRLVVSGAYDYMVKVWDPRREECLHTLQGHTNRVYSLQFDGVHVVSGSLDTSIRVWDVETGACRHQLMGHQSLTSGMELRNNILVSGNADSTVKVWDILTGQCLQTLAGAHKHQSAVTCLQFNSKFVVTSSDDGTVKLWDLRTGEFLRNLVALESGGSGGVVWRLRASSTKLVCAVGSRNGTEETKLLVLDFDEPK
uniref:Putative cdc4 n=1 Tax=Amblyomma aureolatum TaxID=187763 RepID=A0A1E1XB65_9ACAR